MLERSIHIKNYIQTLFAPEDEILFHVRKSVPREKLPNIAVSASIGKFLYLLAKLQCPRRILEIGLLAGYSTTWLARALKQGGKIISLEIDARNISVARDNFKLAGIENLVEIREGRASQLLDQMIGSEEEPFDLVFLDADKKNYPIYLEKILKLSRPGTLILTDNLIPKGEEIHRYQDFDEGAKGVYRFNQLIANHPQLETILTPTLASQGRVDAVGISIVRE